MSTSFISVRFRFSPTSTPEHRQEAMLSANKLVTLAGAGFTEEKGWLLVQAFYDTEDYREHEARRVADYLRTVPVIEAASVRLETSP